MKLTLESFALGDTDAIDHLVLGEDVLDGQLLLEVLASEINLRKYKQVIRDDVTKFDKAPSSGSNLQFFMVNTPY